MMGYEFKIEKGFKMPSTSGRKSKYPWREMEVGDSFFAANMSLATIVGSHVKAGQRLGVKFAARTVDGGVRVWRVK